MAPLSDPINLKSRCCSVCSYSRGQPMRHFYQPSATSRKWRAWLPPTVWATQEQTTDLRYGSVKVPIFSRSHSIRSPIVESLCYPKNIIESMISLTTVIKCYLLIIHIYIYTICTSRSGTLCTWTNKDAYIITFIYYMCSRVSHRLRVHIHSLSLLSLLTILQSMDSFLCH